MPSSAFDRYQRIADAIAAEVGFARRDASGETHPGPGSTDVRETLDIGCEALAELLSITWPAYTAAHAAAYTKIDALASAAGDDRRELVQLARLRERADRVDDYAREVFRNAIERFDKYARDLATAPGDPWARLSFLNGTESLILSHGMQAPPNATSLITLPLRRALTVAYPDISSSRR